MSLRKRRPHHDLWLISYADLVTLLFALFVLLFAMARAERAQAIKLADSLRRALNSRPTPAPPRPAVNELTSAFERLQLQLAPELAAGRMKVALEARGVVISLREGAFFGPGSDAIDSSAFDSMAKVAAIIRDLPNSVRLEGHTDSVPIQTGRFRSNWELSAARSIAVLTYFQHHFDISGDRFSIAGFADRAPVADNESAGGRAQNRRVDVVILSEPIANTAPLP